MNSFSVSVEFEWKKAKINKWRKLPVFLHIITVLRSYWFTTPFASILCMCISYYWANFCFSNIYNYIDIVIIYSVYVCVFHSLFKKSIYHWSRDHLQYHLALYTCDLRSSFCINDVLSIRRCLRTTASFCEYHSQRMFSVPSVLYIKN